MARRKGILAEAVFLFQDDSSTIDNQMLWGEFSALASRAVALESRAGQTVRAIYAGIGPGLSVKSMTCFTLAFDAEGFVDEDWNVPVQDLADHAGDGPNLGNGPVGLASRSQCSIPWVTLRLWEPDLRDPDNPCMQVQRAVWENKLGMPGAGKPRFQRTGRWKVTPPGARKAQAILGQLADGPASGPGAGPAADPDLELDLDFDLDAAAMPATARTEPPLLQERVDGAAAAAARAEQRSADAQGVRERLNERFDAAFGDARRIPVERLVQHSSGRAHELVKQHQRELDKLHQEHMKQLRSYRQEIQRLRAELERERSRNQLLEGFLRGEVRA